MREIKTQIDINAPATRVWSILMDFDKYPEWNPFIISIIGKAHLRERLKITVQPKNNKPMRFSPRVTLFKKEQQFGWLGQLLMAGIFDGHHVFEIKEKAEGGCTFTHREEFSGLLVPLFWKNLDTNTRAGFEAMNIKLKELSEK